MTKRWITYFLFAVLGAFTLLVGLNLAGFGPALVQHESVRVVLPPQRQVQHAQPARRPTAFKPLVTTSAPAPQPVPAPSVQQMPMPAPTPSPVVVQPPVVPQTPCSQADNYYCAALPLAVEPQSTPTASAQSPRPVNVLYGNTFQLNILSGNGSYNGGARYGYSTYGWTPGHEELRYDPRTGTYYRVWVAHPQPGY